MGKGLPYVNSDHIVNIYKINNNPSNPKNPYIQASNRYKNNNDKYYVKNLDKNYENYKQKKINNGSSNYLDISQNYGISNNNKIVPNKKLSPINKKMIKL